MEPLQRAGREKEMLLQSARIDPGVVQLRQEKDAQEARRRLESFSAGPGRPGTLNDLPGAERDLRSLALERTSRS